MSLSCVHYVMHGCIRAGGLSRSRLMRLLATPGAASNATLTDPEAEPLV